MDKLRLLCLTLIMVLLMPYICYAQDSIPDEAVTAVAESEPTVGEPTEPPVLPEFEGATGWSLPELTQAFEFGLTTESSIYDMSSSITREEFCELAVLFYEKYTGKEAEQPSVNPFTDTTNPNIMKAVRLGITFGVTPTSFKPSGLITKQDMAVMIVRAMKSCEMDTTITTVVDQFTDYYKIGSHALSSVEALQERGILKGVTSGTVNGVVKYQLDPLGSIPKQEAIILLKRAFEYACMVRNASKWGPDVYIPKLEVGDKYLISPEPVVIENDKFHMSLLPNTAYDKNFEKRLLEMMEHIEVVTGLSFYPNGNEPKVEITQFAGPGHAAGGYSGIYIFNMNFTIPEVYYAANNILIHELLHCIMFRNIADECIYDKSLTVFIEGYSTFLSSYIEFLYYDPIYAQINIERNLLYLNDKDVENNLMNFSEDIFKQQQPVPLNDPTYQNPYIIGYKFCYYINETYGIDVFKKIVLDNDNFNPFTDNYTDTFISRMKDNTSQTLFNDFAKWYSTHSYVFNVKNSVTINGTETPLAITTSQIDNQYPSVKLKKYGLNRNIVMYIIESDFILKDGFLSIDYTDAIAIAQNNGVNVRGLYIEKFGLQNVLSNGGHFEFYDANGDVIFNGLSDKLFDNVIEERQFYVIYGAVKLEIHAKSGTRLIVYDGSYMKPDMFFSQD